MVSDLLSRKITPEQLPSNASIVIPVYPILQALLYAHLSFGFHNNNYFIFAVHQVISVFSNISVFGRQKIKHLDMALMEAPSFTDDFSLRSLQKNLEYKSCLWINDIAHKRDDTLPQAFTSFGQHLIKMLFCYLDRREREDMNINH